MSEVKQSAPKGTQLSAQRAAGLPLRWASATDPGPRAQNQDVALSVQPSDPRRAARGTLMIVCDGVGGELGGQTAANAAANAMLEAFYADGAAPADAILSAIGRANSAVKTEAEKRPEYKNMATTIVIALAKDDRLYVTNVGDSRAYLLRGGRLRQLTKDHSFIAEQVASGTMTLEEAKKSSMRTFITRSLGASANNRPNDVVVETLQPGDAVMMCSDGVHGAVPDDQIEAMLKQASSPEEAVKAIVKRAVERKTTDNATAAVMMVGAAPSSGAPAAAVAPAKASAAASAPARKLPIGLIFIGLLLAVALAAFGYMAATGLLGGGTSGGGVLPTQSASGPGGAPVGVPTVPGQVAPTEPTATLLPGQPTPTLAPDLPTPTFTPRPLPTQVPPTATVAPAATQAPLPTSPPSNGGGGGGNPQPQPTSAPQPTSEIQPTTAPVPTLHPTSPPQPTTPPQPTSPPAPTSPPQPTSPPAEPTSTK